MCVKFHDEENRLEIMGGASCLYDEIQKCSIQNEDANFKGKTKPFTLLDAIESESAKLGLWKSLCLTVQKAKES